MKSKVFKSIMAVASLVFAATLSVGCYKMDLDFGPPSPKYEDREVGDFKVRFFEDYCEIEGTTEQGNNKRFLVIPEYIDGVRVESLGLYKNVLYDPTGTNLWDLKISSEKLEKVYFESNTKAANTVFSKNTSIKKVMCPELRENRYDISSGRYNTYYPHSVYESVGYVYYQRHVHPANVSFYYNYENAEKSDYYWIDDCDYGGKIEFLPNAPVRDGYEFGGWYKEAECVNAWGFEADTLPELQTEWVEAMWTGDGIRPGDLIEVPKYQETILYAKWTKKNDAQI